MSKNNELQSALRHAETQHACANMIDNNSRRDREVATWAARVTQLKQEIAEASKRRPITIDLAKA